MKSYVYDKYVRDGDFFVDLAWWIETIEGDIWLAGAGDGQTAVETAPDRVARSYAGGEA